MRTLKVLILHTIMILLLISSGILKNNELENITFFLYWFSIIVSAIRSDKNAEDLHEYIRNNPMHKITYLFNVISIYSLLYFDWTVTAFFFTAIIVYLYVKKQDSDDIYARKIKANEIEEKEATS